MNRLRVAVALSVVLLVTLMGAACSGGSEEPATTGEVPEPEVVAESADDMVEEGAGDGMVRIGDTGEGYQWINHELFGLIAEGAYGLAVEIVSIAPEDLQQALTSGEVDVHLEARTPETVGWFDAAVADGTIVNLGTTYETDDGFEVQKGATPEFVAQHAEVAAMLEKMDTRAGSLAKTEKWASRRDDLTNQEVAAYYMYTFDFEDRMKSWMPFEKYRTAKLHMETLYPVFRRCTNCPDPDPDAPGSQ